MESCHMIQSLKHKDRWTKSLANEFGRLAQGPIGSVKGTQINNSINRDTILQEQRKDVSYGRICVSYWLPPKKSWTRTDLPHSWQQSYQLSRRHQHTNIWHHHSQTFHQQHHLYSSKTVWIGWKSSCNGSTDVCTWKFQMANLLS